MQQTTTFLMFSGPQSGKAEEAIQLYVSLFPDSGVQSISRYQANEPGGREGTVKHAVFTLAGTEYMAIDSEFNHAFNFTPSMSIFVTCGSEEEMDRLFQQLSATVMMVPDNYGFSKKFAWVADRFGVSWQLNLP